MKKVINTVNAPKAIGPYSQAIEANGMVFISGQIPINPENGQIPEGIEAQTEQVMKNIGAILKEAGADFSGIVKTNIYLKNFADFERVNKVYESYLGDIKPARTTVEVSRLPKDALVEIECIAYVR